MATSTKSGSGLGTLALVGAVLLGGFYLVGDGLPTGFFGGVFQGRTVGIDRAEGESKDVCFEVVAFGERRVVKISYQTPTRGEDDLPESVGKWKRCVLVKPGSKVSLKAVETTEDGGRKICTIYADGEVIGGPQGRDGQRSCGVTAVVPK